MSRLDLKKLLVVTYTLQHNGILFYAYPRLFIKLWSERKVSHDLLPLTQKKFGLDFAQVARRQCWG